MFPRPVSARVDRPGLRPGFRGRPAFGWSRAAWGGPGTVLAVTGIGLAAAVAPSSAAAKAPPTHSAPGADGHVSGARFSAAPPASRQAVRRAIGAPRGAAAERAAKRREAKRSRCDRRRGTTLAASQVVRFYGIWETASRNDPARGLFACTYRDGRRYRLTRSARSGGPSQFGINGNVLFFVEYERSKEPSRDQGQVYVRTQVWDARTREPVGLLVARSVRYSGLTISPGGVLAAITSPYGSQGLRDDGQPVTPASEVVLYDPTGYTPARGSSPGGYPPWRTLASGAPGAFSQLAASGDTLYWQSAGAIASAPFRAPTGEARPA